jgi:hypothetical protein
VGSGSTFTVAGKGNYTQTAGTTTGGIKISGGSVFGKGGTFSGNVSSVFNLVSSSKVKAS